MIESDDSLSCFDYLMDSMDTKDRLIFESRLEFDSTLREELRNCERELANLAASSTEPFTPSDRVWSGIVSTIELEGRKPRPRSLAWAWFSSKQLLPIAAAIAVALFFFFESREDSGVVGHFEKYPVKRVSAGSKQEIAERSEEIEGLRSEVASLNRKIARGREAEIVLRELDRLQLRRDQLVERIDDLEVEYLALIELATKESESANTNQYGVGLAFSLSLLGDDGSFWKSVSQKLSESSLVALSFQEIPSSALEERFDVVESYADIPGNLGGVPYALAFLDKISGNAVLSLGNLPPLNSGQHLAVWAIQPESGESVALGNLPWMKNGGSGDVAIQVPSGFDDEGSFLVTIEENNTSSDEPSERVVVEAHLEP